MYEIKEDLLKEESKELDCREKTKQSGTDTRTPNWKYPEKFHPSSGCCVGWYFSSAEKSSSTKENEFPIFNNIKSRNNFFVYPLFLHLRTFLYYFFFP